MKESRIIIIGLIVLVFCLMSCKAKNAVPAKKSEQTHEASLFYFGQTTPQSTPVVFAQDIISKPDRYEFGCTLSKDGKTFLFAVDTGPKNEIYLTSLENGAWTTPRNIFPNDSCGYNDPMFSMDEQRIYFISNRPVVAQGQLKDIDIWYIEGQAQSWSEPINLGAPINNELNQYYTSFSKDGSLYFASKDQSEDAPRYAFDIYKAANINGEFATPTKLPVEINTERYEADAFVAPDESYLIFCSIRKNGLGQGDLYISFKNEKDKWTAALNMGSVINTDKHELCPFVTRDGKYLFYTSNEDIYWVSTKVIDELRTGKQ